MARTFSVAVSDELFERLETFLSSVDSTRNAFVRHAIEEALAQTVNGRSQPPPDIGIRSVLDPKPRHVHEFTYDNRYGAYRCSCGEEREEP